VRREPGTVVDYASVAQSYVDRSPELSSTSIRQLGRLRLNLDERYCREVADLFDAAPVLAWSDSLAKDYEIFKRTNLAQYHAIRAAGVEVRPWSHPTQPYRDSADLVRRVRETGVVHVYLTATGHGPGPATGFHPLREPAGVVEHGVELTHNDVFRVVHDVFGHVVHGNSFGPRGEFRATRAHLAMYPERAHPVLLAEQIGQICWFFYGPHLRVDGRLPARGEPGFVDLAGRPYAQQKVFPFPRRHVVTFTELFEEEPG
jgi:hypothetical protein